MASEGGKNMRDHLAGDPLDFGKNVKTGRGDKGGGKPPAPPVRTAEEVQAAADEIAAVASGLIERVKEQNQRSRQISRDDERMNAAVEGMIDAGLLAPNRSYPVPGGVLTLFVDAATGLRVIYLPNGVPMPEPVTGEKKGFLPGHPIQHTNPKDDFE